MTKGRAALPPAGFPESPLSNLNPKQKCHPDRSEAKWRDLLFKSHPADPKWKRRPPLCHPDKSVSQWRDLHCAPRTPRISRIKPQPQNRSVIPTAAERSGGICSAPLGLPNLPFQTSTPPVRIVLHEKSAHRNATGQRHVILAADLNLIETIAGEVFYK
jgi:hypothetical protein